MSSLTSTYLFFISFKQGFSKTILSLTHFVFLGKPEVKHLSFKLDVFITCVFQRHRSDGYTPSLRILV